MAAVLSAVAAANGTRYAPPGGVDGEDDDDDDAATALSAPSSRHGG